MMQVLLAARDCFVLALAAALSEVGGDRFLAVLVPCALDSVGTLREVDGSACLLMSMAVLVVMEEEAELDVAEELWVLDVGRWRGVS
jgi:hypothetical protein